MSARNWMIYGATGYTGRLLAEYAVERGHNPILAGRSLEKLKPIADKLGLEYRAFSVMDKQAALDGVREADVGLVLHAAGPFVYTSSPMLAACLQLNAHYLDLTGEIPVYENTFAHHDVAAEKGLVLISGVGFDIIPSDCLAVHVADQVENATDLEVVIHWQGGGESVQPNISAGTFKSLLEMIPDGIRVRRGGELLRYDVGRGVKEFPFPQGKLSAMAIPWGDVSTAYRSTGIPNITAYMTMNPDQISALQRLGGIVQQVSKFAPLRHFISDQIENFLKGPSQEVRESAQSFIYACASNADGQRAEAWLETAEAYQFTKYAAIQVVEHVLKGAAAGELKGAYTPAQAFGKDFVLEIEGSTRYDALKV